MLKEAIFITFIIACSTTTNYGQSIFVSYAANYVGYTIVDDIQLTVSKFYLSNNNFNVGACIPINDNISVELEYFYNTIFTSIYFINGSGFGVSITRAHNFSTMGVYHLLNPESNFSIDIKAGVQLGYAVRTFPDGTILREHPITGDIINYEIHSVPGLKIHPKGGLLIGYTFFNKIQLFLYGNYYQGFKSQPYQEWFLTIDNKDDTGHYIASESRLYFGIGLKYDFGFL